MMKRGCEFELDGVEGCIFMTAVLEYMVCFLSFVFVVLLFCCFVVLLCSLFC